MKYPAKKNALAIFSNTDYVDNFTGKTYSCDQCEKVYDFKSDLIEHRKYHHEKNVCHICDKTVKSSLQRHIDLMHKVYNDSGNSFILVRDKTKSKPKELEKHSCDCCKKYFSTKANLKQHTDKFHSYTGDQADFDTSNKLFFNSSFMSIHSEQMETF